MSFSNQASASLQWINVTNPCQPVDKATMRNVRTHVMNNYLQKEVQRSNDEGVDSQHGKSGEKRKRSQQSTLQLGINVFRSGSPSGNSNTASSSFSASPPKPVSSDEDGNPKLHHTARSTPKTHSRRTSTTQQYATGAQQRYECAESSNDPIPPIPLSLVDDADVPSTMLSYMWHGVPDRGQYSDPFNTIPQFQTSGIDIERLRSNCVHYFGNCSVKQQWFPIISMSRRSFLSSLCASAAYLDAMQLTQSSGSSPQRRRSLDVERARNRAVFEEVIGLINESLKNEGTRTDDATIVTVLQLLSGELMMANKAVLQMHEQGLWSMIAQRGGLQRLGGEGRIAGMTVVTVFELSIFQERQTRAEYIAYADHMQSWSKKSSSRPFSPSSSSSSAFYSASPFMTVPFVESPLHSPSGGAFTTLWESERCSSKCVEIIALAKKLTDLAVELDDTRRRRQTTMTSKSNRQGNHRQHRRRQQREEEEEEGEGESNDRDQTSRTRRARLYGVVYDIFAFPRDETEDARYEAIRCCARLYASAIWYKVPFSVAGRPPDGGGRQKERRRKKRKKKKKQRRVFCGVTPSIIRHALARTDLFACWDDMIGVLLWVALVAGAAANPTRRAMATEAKVEDEECDDDDDDDDVEDTANRYEKVDRGSKGKAEILDAETEKQRKDFVALAPLFGGCGDGGVGETEQVEEVEEEDDDDDDELDNEEEQEREQEQEEQDEDEDAKTTRKWLIALAMRCTILVAFQNTAAVMATLRRLLVVQELLSEDSWN